jgi:hypothetical protein
MGYRIGVRWGGAEWETDGVQNGRQIGYRMGVIWGTDWETDGVQNGRQMGYRMGDRWGTEWESDGVQNRRQNAGNGGEDRDMRRRAFSVSQAPLCLRNAILYTSDYTLKIFFSEAEDAGPLDRPPTAGRLGRHYGLPYRGFSGRGEGAHRIQGGGGALRI